MLNTKCKMDGDTLIIKVDTKQPTVPSMSGKTRVLAKTGGFRKIAGGPDGLMVNLTVTLPNSI